MTNPTNLEDLLSDMFKSTGLGKGQDVNKLLNTLVRNVQINTLKMLRQEIDKNIKRLQEATPAGEKADANLDPYKILGVDPSATREEIDKAFRKKVKQVHPDVPGGSNEAFIKVMAAYEAIKQYRGWSK